MPISLGCVEGKVRIVNGPSAFKSFKKGEILVTKFLTPDYASVVHKAKGVVADVGGMTSHAAVVVRELGIPCLVGVKGASLILKNGDKVKLDAGKGTLDILSA